LPRSAPELSAPVRKWAEVLGQAAVPAGDAAREAIARVLIPGSAKWGYLLLSHLQNSPNDLSLTVGVPG